MCDNDINEDPTFCLIVKIGLCSPIPPDLEINILDSKPERALINVYICSRGLSHTPDKGLPAGPPLTFQQKLKAIGVPTPLVFSSPLRR